MKTVVYQSYRTVDVPPWIARCMGSVRAWAAEKGFAYHLVDDALFDYAPAWYRARVANQICLVSDLARLVLARELLESYKRAIWIDADAAVIDPQQFNISVTQEYAFSREVWLNRLPDGTVQTWQGVNNSINVLVRGNSILDFYIYACESIVRRKKVIDRLDVGTTFLSRLYSFVPFPLLENTGTLSPLVMQAIITQDQEILQRFRDATRVPIYAVNLCSSTRGRLAEGVLVEDALFDTVLDELFRTQGRELAPRVS